MVDQAYALTREQALAEVQAAMRDERVPILDRANLERTDLHSTDLSGGHLSEANLSEANLSGAYMCGAYLYKANLSGANLVGTDLRKAILIGVNLVGALSARRITERSRFAHHRPGRCRTLNNADLKGAYLD